MQEYASLESEREKLKQVNITAFSSFSFFPRFIEFSFFIYSSFFIVLYPLWAKEQFVHCRFPFFRD